MALDWKTQEYNRSVHDAVEDGGDLLDFRIELGVLGRDDGLDAVGESFFGLVVDFDEQTVGANGYGGAR